MQISFGSIAAAVKSCKTHARQADSGAVKAKLFFLFTCSSVGSHPAFPVEYGTVLYSTVTVGFLSAPSDSEDTRSHKALVVAVSRYGILCPSLPLDWWDKRVEQHTPMYLWNKSEDWLRFRFSKYFVNGMEGVGFSADVPLSAKHGLVTHPDVGKHRERKARKRRRILRAAERPSNPRLQQIQNCAAELYCTVLYCTI